MSNSYFQFKQFIIHQEKCAMKVCTDACVFGAYIASTEKDLSKDETEILDIGAGTGLLSLMLAQKVKGNIEAVEIDNKAYEQAKENFMNNAWKSRLSVLHADITKFTFRKKYNLIVSNPPFFNNSLKSVDPKKNASKHTISLSHANLARVASANLTHKGKFYILLPFEEFKIFEKTALENNLWVVNKINIRHFEHSNYFRTIGVYSNLKRETATEDILTLKKNSDTYTENFIQLLKDYYLYL